MPVSVQGSHALSGTVSQSCASPPSACSRCWAKTGASLESTTLPETRPDLTLKVPVVSGFVVFLAPGAEVEFGGLSGLDVL